METSTPSLLATQSDAISILSLPPEILHHVVALVHGIKIPDQATWIQQARSVIRKGGTYAEKQAAALRDIQHLRLVCRLFKDVASSFLVRYITVRLSPESLERLEGLCRSPAVAQGILGLHVDLRYHPRELADDADLFGQLLTDEAEELCHVCDFFNEGIEMMTPGGSDDEDHEDGLGSYEREEREPWLEEREHSRYCPFPGNAGQFGECSLRKCQAVRTFEVAVEFLAAVSRSQCARVFSSEALPPAEDRQSDEMHRNRRVFLDAYRGFGRKSEVEARMIEDGSFVRRVAAAASRMRNGSALRFNAGDHGLGTILDFNVSNILAWKTDDDRFSEHLQRSVPWASLDHCFRGRIPVAGRARRTADFIVEPARLMYDLPVALHEAGFRIRRLHIAANMPPRGVPRPNTDDGLRVLPVHEEAAGRVARLRAATRDLEELHVVRSSAEDDARVFRSWRGGDIAFGLLAGLLSGSRDRLERLSIELYHPVTMEEDDEDAGSVSALQMGRDIGTVTSLARVRHVFIGRVTISQEALEGFCAALGHSLRSVYIADTVLVGRSWANVVDILREKLTNSRRANGVDGDECGFRWTEVSGGEFGNRPTWVEGEDLSAFTRPPRALVLNGECCDYINGVGGDENPLRRRSSRLGAG
jgi:hypothetical protein